MVRLESGYGASYPHSKGFPFQVALSPPQKHCKEQPEPFLDQNISNTANKLQVADRAQAIGKARQSGLGD